MGMRRSVVDCHPTSMSIETLPRVGSLVVIAFWLHDGRLVAGMNVNMWGVTEPIRQLIESGGQVDATRLSDLDVPLTALTP